MRRNELGSWRDKFVRFGETVVLQGALAQRDMPTQGHKPYIPYQPCGATIMASFMWVGEV